MRFRTKFAAAALGVACSLTMANPAGAVVVGISAPSPDPKAPGADPLSNAFITNVGGLYWTMGLQLFNTPALTYGDGLPYATVFRYTLNDGVNNGVDLNPANTYFNDISTNQTWLAAYFSAGPSMNQRIEFTAPSGSAISPGDLFRIRVGFIAPVSPNLYSWSASWNNSFSPGPEPATWALMIGGLVLAGSALRRRRSSARRPAA